MERLTKRNKDGLAYYPKCFEEPCAGRGCQKKFCENELRYCEKLAAYEDIGTVEEFAELKRAESDGRIVPNIKEGQVFISQNSVVEHAHWSGDLWMDSLNGLHFVFHDADYDWQAEAKYVHGTFEAALAAKEERE